MGMRLRRRWVWVEHESHQAPLGHPELRHLFILNSFQDDEGLVGRDDDNVVGACIGVLT
jgi:hypothetical protein